MKKLSQLLAGSTVLTALSTSVVAHPGHDHSHWTSPMMHSILGFSILAVAGFAAWKLRSRVKNTEKGKN